MPKLVQDETGQYWRIPTDGVKWSKHRVYRNFCPDCGKFTSMQPKSKLGGRCDSCKSLGNSNAKNGKKRKDAAEYILRECPICGIEYEANTTRLKWGRETTCSRDCSYVYRGRKQWKRHIRICAICGKEDTIRNEKEQPNPLCYSCHMIERQTGAKNHNWKGGMVGFSDYKWVRIPEHHLSNCTGYVAEHRVIMEQELGRALLPGEVVHHINYDKKDNRPENLWLFKNIEEHQRWHQWLIKRERIH